MILSSVRRHSGGLSAISCWLKFAYFIKLDKKLFSIGVFMVFCQFFGIGRDRSVVFKINCFFVGAVVSANKNFFGLYCFVWMIFFSERRLL